MEMVNDSLHVQRSAPAFYSEAFSCSAHKLWNNLPRSVKVCNAFNFLKRSLKIRCGYLNTVYSSVSIVFVLHVKPFI